VYYWREMASSFYSGLAAQQLVAARKARTPGDRLPERCRPSNLEEALEIQRCVRVLLDDSVGGWKCSVPGPDVTAAPIYASTIHSAFPCPVLTYGAEVRVEPEIAFVLSRDLPLRDVGYSEGEMLSAIAETHLVLELIGGRYAESAIASFPELLADNLSNQGLFVGPLVSREPGELPGEFPITVEGPKGVLMRRPGRHPDGHPLRTFCCLVQFLAQRGEALKKGQVIITGSFAGVLEVPVSVPIRLRFGELGVLTVQFCPADDAIG
jgi:2-keto-4-pentenoate hydratase